MGVTAFLTGYLAAQYGLRPVPIYLGVGYAVLGTALSILLVRDTRAHVRLEIGNSPRPPRQSASGTSSRSPPSATATFSRHPKRNW